MMTVRLFLIVLSAFLMMGFTRAGLQTSGGRLFGSGPTDILLNDSAVRLLAQ